MSTKDIEAIMDIAATYKNIKLAEFGLHLIKQANLPTEKPPQEVSFVSASTSHDPDHLYDAIEEVY